MAKISSAARAILDEVSAPFQLSDAKLVEITNSLVGEFNAGLKESGRSVVMGLTYVTRVPNGTEAGTFLTIDLIWRSLRISEITFHGNNKSSRRDKVFQIPNNVASGTSAAFFDHVATSVDSFLKENRIQLTSQTLIGISFPFGVRRTDLNKAKIMSWGKGIALQDGPGQGVDELLDSAFDRKGLNLKCGAIVNDTVTLLLSESYGDPSQNCHISAIFGVGTNGAYVENTAKIPKLDKQGSPRMIVNTELGGYSNRSVLPLTEIDYSMDEDSREPGIYLFEKLVSWVFLGELVRRILVSIEQKSLLALSKGATSGIKDPGSFNSRCLPMIDAAKTPDDVKKILADNGIPLEIATDEDAEIVRSVSQLVSSRAIRLCACAIAALINQVGYKRDSTERLVVAITGDLVFFYPQFESVLRNALKSILGESVEKRISFLNAEDAEPIGAALGVHEMTKRG